MTTVDICGGVGPEGNDNGSGTQELRNPRRSHFGLSVSVRLLKTDKQANNGSDNKQNKNMVSRTKELFHFEQLLKCGTAEFHHFSTHLGTVLGREAPRVRAQPMGDSSLTSAREKDFCIVAQDLCFYFVVNDEPKGKEMQFFR